MVQQYRPEGGNSSLPVPTGTAPAEGSLEAAVARPTTPAGTGPTGTDSNKVIQFLKHREKRVHGAGSVLGPDPVKREEFEYH